MDTILTDRENFLRAVEFRNPEWIPIRFDMFPAVKMKHGDALKDLFRAHPFVLDAAAERQRRAAQLVHGGDSSIATGGFFDRLQFLRGLDNLLVDLANHAPQLQALIEIVLDYHVSHRSQRPGCESG